MARVTTKLSDYQNLFSNIRLTRDDEGILLVQFHTDGGDIVWGLTPHEEVAACWDYVARDLENRVVIITGTNETFIHLESIGADEDFAAPDTWWRIHNVGKRLLLSQLDIEVPVIAAVNGHATVHAEQALLADIVLSAEDAVWADRPHYPAGLVPGDGVQIVFAQHMGLNRARYMLLTGQQLTAAEAKDFGLVSEVLPRDQVLGRAYELARQLLKAPDKVLRSSRNLLTHELRRLLNDGLGYGLAIEGLAAIEYLSQTGGAVHHE